MTTQPAYAMQPALSVTCGQVHRTDVGAEESRVERVGFYVGSREELVGAGTGASATARVVGTGAGAGAGAGAGVGAGAGTRAAARAVGARATAGAGAETTAIAAAGSAGTGTGLEHKLSVMSLNCRGLRPRTGLASTRARLARLKRCRLIQQVVAEHKPDILMLQETWHRPHDGELMVEGYRYEGRPRVTPAGRSTTSGGVGILVSVNIPVSAVERRDAVSEADSTGMLWLDVTLEDTTVVSLGTVYSECSGRSKMGLDMDEVWRARSVAMAGILGESRGPMILMGDFNAHLGPLQEDLLRSRQSCLGKATRSSAEVKHAAPLVQLLETLPVVVLNGRHEPGNYTWFSTAAEASGLARMKTRKQTRRPSVIDLAVVSSAHEQAWVKTFEVRPIVQLVSDHRALWLELRLPAELKVSGPPKGKEGGGKRAPRLPTEGGAKQRMDAAVNDQVQQWSHMWGAKLSSSSWEELAAAYVELEEAMKQALGSSVGTKSTAVSAELRKKVAKRAATHLRQWSVNATSRRARRATKRKRALLARARWQKEMRDLERVLDDLDEALLGGPIPDLRAAYRFEKQLMGTEQKRGWYPVKNSDGAWVTAPGDVAEVFSGMLGGIGIEIPAATPVTQANDKFAERYARDGRDMFLADDPPRRVKVPLGEQVYKEAVQQLNRLFCAEELRAALQRSDKRSAAGEDGISYAVLDALSDRSLLVLCGCRLS